MCHEMLPLSAGWFLKKVRCRTGTLVKTLRGHTDFVLTVALAPDGCMMITGSADATVGVWNVKEGAAPSLLQNGAVHGDYRPPPPSLRFPARLRLGEGCRPCTEGPRTGPWRSPDFVVVQGRGSSGVLRPVCTRHFLDTTGHGTTATRRASQDGSGGAEVTAGECMRLKDGGRGVSGLAVPPRPNRVCPPSTAHQPLCNRQILCPNCCPNH